MFLAESVLINLLICETKFYKVNHDYMSVDKFLSTSSISKEKIERLREKLYPKIEPKQVEEKQDIVIKKEPINIPVYPKKTFEEMLRDVDMNRRRSNLLRRRKNISTWYVNYKHDIDEMFLEPIIVLINGISLR